MKYYYSEDIIISLRDKLNSVKGLILMDDDNELMILKDFYIESVTTTKGLFKKREVTEFYIKRLEFSSGKNAWTHEDDGMCTWYGVDKILMAHLRWTDLQKKLIKFSLDTGMPLNFSGISKQ
jgi:hypothetical protein